MQVEGSKTHDNLKAAFAGESQANRRYLYFAAKADVEGQNDVAALFRSTAEGETGHAHGHLEYLEPVGDPATDKPIGRTRLNLAAAVAGETHEYTDMYPGMAKTARGEGFTEIADWFETLAKAERSHANRFQKALDASAGLSRDAMPQIAPESLLSLEAYARERGAYRARVIAHKKLRTRARWASTSRCIFEDELTIRYQVQEMLRIERIFEDEGIRGELEAYNPLIPDGRNWKATMLIEYPDEDERRRAPGRAEGHRGPHLGAGRGLRARVRHRRRGPRARERGEDLGGAFPALRARPRRCAPRSRRGAGLVGRRRSPELPRQRRSGARGARLARRRTSLEAC